LSSIVPRDAHAGSPGEAREIGRLFELHLKAVELHEIQARLAALESKQP
jgi:hypothetical protein